MLEVLSSHPEEVFTPNNPRLKIHNDVSQIFPPDRDTWMQIVRGGFKFNRKDLMKCWKMDQTALVRVSEDGSFGYQQATITRKELEKTKHFSIIEDERVEISEDVDIPIPHHMSPIKDGIVIHWAKNFKTKYHIDANGISIVLALSPDSRGYKIWKVQKLDYRRYDKFEYEEDFKFDDDAIIVHQYPGDIVVLSSNCIHEVYSIGEVWGNMCNHLFNNASSYLDIALITFMDSCTFQSEEGVLSNEQLTLQSSSNRVATYETNGEEKWQWGVNCNVSYGMAHWLMKEAPMLEKTAEEMEAVPMGDQKGWFDPKRLLKDNSFKIRFNLQPHEKEKMFRVALGILALNGYTRYDGRESIYKDVFLPPEFNLAEMWSVLEYSVGFLGGIDGFIQICQQDFGISPAKLYTLLNLSIEKWPKEDDILWAQPYVDSPSTEKCTKCSINVDCASRPNEPIQMIYCGHCDTVNIVKRKSRLESS